MFSEEKLIATKSYHLKMMEELDIDLLEMFLYFFTNPSMVMQSIFEYNTRISCANIIILDSF